MGSDISEQEEFDRLLLKLPGRAASLVRPRIRHEIEEIRFALGLPLTVKYADILVQYPYLVDAADMKSLETCGPWREDGRLGIDGALHRLSLMTDSQGLPNIVKVRVARALVGVAEPLREVITQARRGRLIVGPPGVGKTTLQRDILRIKSETLGERLYVVDTSNELFGDGVVPHRMLGMATRVMVGNPKEQPWRLNMTIGNMGPAELGINEIGYRDDVPLVVFAAGRGVAVTGTVHGETIHDVWRTERFWPMIGRAPSGALIEPPIFGALIEVRAKGEYVVYDDLPGALEQISAGHPVAGRAVSLRHTARDRRAV